MNKPKSILDFFKAQSPKISCPACGILLQKCNLNAHLDHECASSSSFSGTATYSENGFQKSSNSNLGPEMIVNSVKLGSKKRKFTKATSKITCMSSRLSLKGQKKNLKKEVSIIKDQNRNVQVEVVTLDDDISLSGHSNIATTLTSSDTTNLIIPEKNKTLSFDLCTDSSQQSNNNHHNRTTVAKGHVYKNEAFFGENKSVQQVSLTPSKDEAVKFSIGFQNVNTAEKILSLDEPKCENITTKPSVCASLERNNISSMTIKGTNETASKITAHEVIPQKSNDNIHFHNPVTDDYHDICVENNNKKSSENFTDNLSHRDIEELNSIHTSDIVAILEDAERCMEEDDDVFTEKSESNKNSEAYSPYYIANFKHILSTVLNEEFNKILFNDEDRTYIKAFQTSSDAAQKLYVRLFQRKYKWLRLNKINYPNITGDPGAVLKELIEAELIDSGLDNIDLETALDLLSLPEAKNVLKQFNFTSSGKSKADITHMLLKHCKEYKSVFFSSGRSHVSTMMLKKVKQVLGQCYRISLLPKRLFTRILMLFSLPTHSVDDDDDAAGGQQQQLFTLLQVNKGEIAFPDYKINRQTMIFIERDELIRYEEARQLENDIMNAVESKNFDLAKELCINAKEEFENQLLSPFVERVASLPTFLKKFTSFHVYVRCMTQGVEILQKLKQYKEAVELLKRLLAQKVFCQDYHGRWTDRLALNLEQHLKQREKALEAIKEGINDKNIRVAYRYSLLVRARRILKTVDAKDEFENEIHEATNVIEAPKVVIKGRLCPKSIVGRTNVFISSSSALVDEDDITVLGVEQLAIEHYKSEGFTEGIHGEGSTFHSLYGLLFWDIIYDGAIPDAFISPYQTHPLDLNHDSFFARREKQIMNHLEHLKRSTIEEIKEIAKSTWEAHFGQFSLVIWDKFTDVDHILGLVGCMSNDLLCGICERLARDFRFTRSGVPDLVVWNPDTLQVKIVEVKGPGDRLSSKQILWLDYLLKLGASAEVCHIEAVGSKKLRKE